MASGSTVSANRHRGAAAKYLTFRLGDEEYGIGVTRVREIMGIQHITPIPKTPSHVRGVINLRGQVIPVIDIRKKLGFESKDDDKRTCIVVLSARVDGQERRTGVVVDRVSEVASIEGGEVKSPPTFGAGGDVSYLTGLARNGSRVRMLLDIDRLMDANAVETAIDADRPAPSGSSG